MLFYPLASLAIMLSIIGGIIVGQATNDPDWGIGGGFITFVALVLAFIGYGVVHVLREERRDAAKERSQQS
jgi:amino acid transporter